MKKIVSLLLSTLFLLSYNFLFACNSDNKSNIDFFSFQLIDEYTYFHNDESLDYLEQGTYIIVSLNKYLKLPEVLVIPEEYNGKKVTAIGSKLLDGANIRTLILPKSIKLIGNNLCDSNCATLKHIICLGNLPFYLGSFAFDQSQLRGGCKIYVPDTSLYDYKNFKVGSASLGGAYKNLIVPHSELANEIKEQISDFL